MFSSRIFFFRATTRAILNTKAELRNLTYTMASTSSNIVRSVERPRALSPQAPSPVRSTLKAVAIDLDGTFLGPDSQVSPGSYKTLMALREMGILAFFATGRSLSSAKFLTSKQNLSPGDIDVFPGTYLNGCVAFDKDGNCILRQGMEKEAYIYILKLLNEMGLMDYCAIYGENGVYAGSKNVSRETFCDMELDTLLGADTASDEGIYGINCLKIALFPTEIVELRKKLEPILPPGTYCLFTSPALLEIMPKAASKGLGVKKILEQYGLGFENVVAIGDGENDVAMLEHAGLALAMENASEKCRNAAHYLVGSCAEDGLSYALQWVFDIPAEKLSDIKTGE